MYISISVTTYMQAASVQKHPVSSLQLLPSADRWFTCQWRQFALLTGRLPVSACQMRINLSVLTGGWHVRQSFLHFLGEKTPPKENVNFNSSAIFQDVTTPHNTWADHKGVWYYPLKIIPWWKYPKNIFIFWQKNAF